MDKTSSKCWTLCIYLALALSILAVFWQVRNCEFDNYVLLVTLTDDTADGGLFGMRFE